ncbi:hypothetical protein KIK15_06245 [Williamsia sp. CHRR-6]|nr:hypothetical protein [Williamsia sp. CHRR-6]
MVASATAVGRYRQLHGEVLFVPAPPLFAHLDPHTGPGTVPAIALAVAAVVYAPTLARRLPWRPLLAVGWAAATVWTFALASIDLTRRPLGAPLTDRNEYLYEIPRAADVSEFLRTFTDHILDFRPDSWTTHVSSHPPLATLFFVALDRVGLGGGTMAAVAVIAVGSLAAVAVPVTMRALAAPAAARAVWPFVVFFPGAVWVGASADGMFMGVSATGVAVVAVGVAHRGRLGMPIAAVGGALLGVTVYLSYGLATFGVLVAMVALLSGLRMWPRGPGARAAWLMRWGAATVGAGVVAVAMTASGFSWIEGLRLLHTRYYQGVASMRPYDYFVWANLAALCLSAGPACAVAVARSVRVMRTRARHLTAGGGSWAALVPAALTLAALSCVLIADASGLSKAETERIWLPFGVWLLSALALVPSRGARWVLAVQVGTALVVNHLLLTHW